MPQGRSHFGEVGLKQAPLTKADPFLFCLQGQWVRTPAKVCRPLKRLRPMAFGLRYREVPQGRRVQLGPRHWAGPGTPGLLRVQSLQTHTHKNILARGNLWEGKHGAGQRRGIVLWLLFLHHVNGLCRALLDARVFYTKVIRISSKMGQAPVKLRRCSNGPERRFSHLPSGTRIPFLGRVFLQSQVQGPSIGNQNSTYKGTSGTNGAQGPGSLFCPHENRVLGQLGKPKDAWQPACEVNTSARTGATATRAALG